MYRLFVSIELPDDVKQALARLSGDVPGARWLEADEMHLTVRFIGEVDGLVYEDVLSALDDVCVAPFELTVRGVGHFPPRGEPKILWAGLERSDALLVLHDRVESALVRAGVEGEHRKFAPHVTLARLKGTPSRAVGSFLAMNGLFRAAPFVVREFHLYSSSLGAKRAVHRCEASYALDGGKA
ncbi:RNA 2',3'-cyclic phosphodiesterase [Candidatus Binatia bacterium]|jgi:2'-5' RNA ligase|nr:RNA 2',3'-cyclic phosphodiesterase [Candidatus Binatia bacterium]